MWGENLWEKKIMARFEEGKVYRDGGDFPYRVVRRNEKSIWIEDLVLGGVSRRKILHYDNGGEFVCSDSANDFWMNAEWAIVKGVA